VDIELAYLKPSMTAKRNVTQYALNQIGLRPYIWGGEWNAASPPGYCCGTQPQAGMDCSGFVWWVMKKYENGYNAAQFRSYGGWSLPERSSSYMAQYAPTHIAFSSLQVGDLMFFASNGGDEWTDVDHVGIWVGKGWMIDTGTTHNGASLTWAGDGYYYDHFVYGRRLIGVAPQIHPAVEDLRTAGDRGAF
jgi:cell wall-associated NlpC family hydrolase